MYSKIATSPAMLIALLIASPRAAADKWENINVDKAPGLTGNEIQFVEPLDGEIWIGTLSGLTRYKDGKFSAVTAEKTKRARQGNKRVEVTEEVPAKFQAWDILDTGGGSYLVGTHAGVYPLKDGKVGEVALKQFTVSPVLRYGASEVWALCKDRGTEQNSLYHRVEGEWKPIDAFAGKRIANLSQTPDGHMWVVIDGDGVLEIDPKSGVEKAADHLQGMNVTSVFQTGKGEVWCGTWGRGVFSKMDGDWISYLGDLKSAVLDIDQDDDGNIWVATTADGLWRRDGEEWSAQLIGEGPINLLFADRDGRVWVSSQLQGGLRYWDGRQWVVSLASPLPMRCLVQDQQGRLWAGGVLDGLHVKGGL